MAAATPPESTPLGMVAWHVSTRSGNGSGNCVEAGSVRDGSGRYAVRDSKDRGGPILVFADGGWGAFLAGLKHGEFDLPA
ncbi:DUF397 domain-containing protein [Micromonospora sp. NPDC003197]